MDKIKFAKTTQEAKLRSPLLDFKLVSESIEIRQDPLTGRRCRIKVERARRPKQTHAETGFNKIIESSRAKCFFCPENIEKATPMFAEGLPDRIKVGNSCLFPNLFPFGGHHAVGIFSNDHYLQLNEFKPKLIQDCFTACIKYFKLISDKYPELKFWHINWNCLPPGAASIIHPHVQIFADSDPTPFLKELVEKSRVYHAKYQTNYWADLVETERTNRERYVGESKGVHWMASFAPQGNKEVLAIVEDVSSLSHFKLDGFCEGFSRILKGYHELGVRSINLTTFSGPSDEDMKDFYWLNTRLIARPNPAPFYVSDCGFMEKLHFEPVIETMPEDLTKDLKKYF